MKSLFDFNINVIDFSQEQLSVLEIALNMYNNNMIQAKDILLIAQTNYSPSQMLIILQTIKFAYDGIIDQEEIEYIASINTPDEMLEELENLIETKEISYKRNIF